MATHTILQTSSFWSNLKENRLWLWSLFGYVAASAMGLLLLAPQLMYLLLPTIGPLGFAAMVVAPWVVIPAVALLARPVLGLATGTSGLETVDPKVTKRYAASMLLAGSAVAAVGLAVTFFCFSAFGATQVYFSPMLGAGFMFSVLAAGFGAMFGHSVRLLKKSSKVEVLKEVPPPGGTYSMLNSTSNVFGHVNKYVEDASNAVNSLVDSASGAFHDLWESEPPENAEEGVPPPMDGLIYTGF